MKRRKKVNAFLNRVSMTVLVVVILAALPGCGAVKKAKQAADAIDQAKEALQDIAQDEADQGGKSAEQIEAESILAKATEAGPIRYHEITKSDGEPWRAMFG
jgi:phosphoribosyl-dephospho-CoA transferase